MRPNGRDGEFETSPLVFYIEDIIMDTLIDILDEVNSLKVYGDHVLGYRAEVTLSEPCFGEVHSYHSDTLIGVLELAKDHVYKVAGYT